MQLTWFQPIKKGGKKKGHCFYHLPNIPFPIIFLSKCQILMICKHLTKLEGVGVCHPWPWIRQWRQRTLQSNMEDVQMAWKNLWNIPQLYKLWKSRKIPANRASSPQVIHTQQVPRSNIFLPKLMSQDLLTTVKFPKGSGFSLPKYPLVR